MPHAILQTLFCLLRSEIAPGLSNLKSKPCAQKKLGGLHPIPRDPKDNGVAAMLDDRTI